MVRGNDSNRIYNAIIISMIIGIVLTIVVLVITFEKPETFTEVYFEDSENLPENINLNQNYDFSFTIQSSENKTHNYQSKIELYNLYDITEGTYKCLAKYRDKIRLKWVFGELIDNITFSKIKDFLGDKEKSDLIRNVYTSSVENLDLELIEWKDYNIEYSYKTIDNIGQINTVFMDKNGIKYALIFSEATNDILFLSFNNGKINIKKKEFSFEPGRWYNIKIIMKKNTFQLYINENLILTKEDIQTKNLKIGFETKNTYASIRFFKIYKEDFSLKDFSSIREFDIDGGDMIEEHNKLVDKKIDYLSLTVSEGLEKDYFKIAYDAYNLNNPKNTGYEIKDYENRTQEIIKWNNYDFEFKYRIEANKDVMAFFKDLEERLLYALIISEEKKYVFLLTFGKETKIIRKEISGEGIRNVKINVKDKKIKIYIDDKLIISQDIINKNGKIGFSLKNYVDIFDVSVINNQFNKEDLTVYQKYWKKYSIENKPLIKKESDIVPVVSREIKEPDFNDYISNDYPIFEIEEINPYIKDTIIAFNGPKARIQNWTDYTFTFNYIALDGLKEIVASFRNLNEDKYSIIIAETINKVFFTYNNKELTKEVEITQEKWHWIKLEFKEKNALIYFDNELLFTIRDVDFSNGYFVLETKNTNAHFRWVSAYSKEEVKKYEIEEDPCQPKKIGEQIIDKKQIKNLNEKITMKKSFMIKELCDYAKISVEVDDQEIHFWVTRG